VEISTSDSDSSLCSGAGACHKPLEIGMGLCCERVQTELFPDTKHRQMMIKKRKQSKNRS